MTVADSAVTQADLNAIQNKVTRKLRFVALAVPIIALLAATAVIPIEPRFGLLAAALIFGWTQLVGL